MNSALLQQIANPAPLKLPDPVENLQKVQQIKNQIQEGQMNGIALQNAQQGQKDQAALRAEATQAHDILVRHNGDLKAAMPELQQAAPHLVEHFQTTLTATEKADQERQNLDSQITTREKNATEANRHNVAMENKPNEVSAGATLVPPNQALPYTAPVKAEKPANPSQYDQELAAFSADPKLTAKYGAGPNGFTAKQQADRISTATASRAPGAGQADSNPVGDFSKTGDEFLTTIPIQWRTTVKKLAHYDQDPTHVTTMRGGDREKVMQWVNQVNPEYDASKFALRAPTRKAFTTGVQGQQINAMNTVIGHMDQMTSAIDALNHGNFIPGNAAYDWVRTTFGSSAVTNFNNIKGAIAGELGKVLKGVATEGEIARVEQNIRSAGSPDQLRGAIDTNIPIIGSKLAALDYQYHQAMGADSFSALSQDSKSVLVKHGFDPAHPTLNGGGGKVITPALIQSNLRANPSMTKQQVIDNLKSAGYQEPE